jgi:2-hydroxy-6-oxonona-2,4-dienedioate hydrolase
MVDPAEDGELIPSSAAALFARDWQPGEATSRPAVLLHGAVIASGYMSRLGRLLGEFMPVYAPDLPGFGLSGHLPLPGSVTGIADVVASWMEREGLLDALVVGHSLGCQVATELALRHPTTTRALVLVGPMFDPTSRPPTRMFGRSMGVIFSEPVPLHAMWTRDLFRVGLADAVRTFRASLAHRIEVRLPDVQVPTLVLRGDRDRFVSQRWVEDLTATIPRGHLELVEDAGHAAHYSRPQEVATSILSFLKRG